MGRDLNPGGGGYRPADRGGTGSGPLGIQRTTGHIQRTPQWVELADTADTVGIFSGRSIFSGLSAVSAVSVGHCQ